METSVGCGSDLSSSTASNERRQRTVTLPDEIIFFDILTRLPVKSLQFRSVSKLWCSLISSPAFVNLQLTRSLAYQLDGFALLILFYDRRSSELVLLPASHGGDLASHFLTLPDSTKHHSVSKNLNGFVGLHHPNRITLHCPNTVHFDNIVRISNPGMQETLKLPVNFQIPNFAVHLCYNFGFESSRNEYKVLNIRVKLSSIERKDQVECEIFTLGGTDSWRKIHPVFPFDVMANDWLHGYQQSVCVNDAIHWILCTKGIIIAFDLRDENFHVIPLPCAAIASGNQKSTFVCGITLSASPYMIRVNGLLAVICCEHAMEQNMIEIWILEDYHSEVWITESITFLSPWADLVCPLPYGTIYTGELLLVPHSTFLHEQISNELVSILFYDMCR